VSNLEFEYNTIQYLKKHEESKGKAEFKDVRLDLVVFVLVVQNDKILLIKEPVRKGKIYRT
jgi:hypothetical protein